MATIELVTIINAPLQRVFDLARSIDLHQESTGATRETAVAGVTSGLIGADGEVTWRARHLLAWRDLSVRITKFDQPHLFVDEMVKGDFKQLRHEHRFEKAHEGTRMRDSLTFTCPYGLLGLAVEMIFLKGYMERFLKERNKILKEVAESDRWREFLPAT
ncbi:MAG: SRPBCC family protein [Armatimonadetes bacterium]|nr:SRPBCC family protein [Armatimonadota bacterium]